MLVKAERRKFLIADIHFNRILINRIRAVIIDVYRIAESVKTSGNSLTYMSGDYTIATATLDGSNSATVTANAGLNQEGGTPFGATEMQFIGFINNLTSNKTAFTQVPQFPFTMTRRASSTSVTE